MVLEKAYLAAGTGGTNHDLKGSDKHMLSFENPKAWLEPDSDW